MCLWTSSSTEADITGKIGIIVGWGKNENGDPEPDEPKKARVRVVTQQACAQQDLLRNIISDKTFCAEGNGFWVFFICFQEILLVFFKHVVTVFFGYSKWRTTEFYSKWRTTEF